MVKTTHRIVMMFVCLLLSLGAGAQNTHWTVDPYAYQYDMTAYVTLTLNNKAVNNLTDYEIAAFCGTECRGIATIQSSEKDGQTTTYGYLRIRSNQQSGETITFKVYDKVSEKEYNVEDYALNFQSQAVVGLPSSSVQLAVLDIVAYNEEATNVIEDVDVANVTITRTIKEGFNTVVLPFDLTPGQVEGAFGIGTTVYTYSEDSEKANKATVYFNKNNAGTISANVPVLVKATVASTSQTFEGVQIVTATEATVTGKNFDFVGTYAPIEVITAGDYFIGNGKIFKSAGATSMNAFRAYIHAKTPEARVERFILDGDETTAITDMERGTVTTGKVYNMSGQEVKIVLKGIYIQNGRKVAIK